MYKHDQTFGGVSILLIGDFIQLPVTTGHDLWSVMYGTVSGNDGTAHELFQQFCVKELTVNIQSSECVCVSDLRLRLGYCKCMRYQSLVPSR